MRMVPKHMLPLISSMGSTYSRCLVNGGNVSEQMLVLYILEQKEISAYFFFYNESPRLEWGTF
jgi:hypothetical protein